MGPQDGRLLELGGIGVRYMIAGDETGGRFSLVEHPLQPRVLAAPMHRHANEDEYSFVLSGRVGMQLGDETLFAGPGSLVRKPRGEWHTFWNAGDDPASLLELISPAGFERYFEEIAGYLTPDGPPDLDLLVAAAKGYGLEFDMESVPGLIAAHGLVSDDLPPEG